MISNPKYGWCDFKIKDFKGVCSYLTDVPKDLLDAFISYFTHGTGIAWIDEEGSEFTLVLNPYSFFIISERDKVNLINLSDVKDIDLAKELIADIEENIDSYSKFWCVIQQNNLEAILEHKKEIELKIKQLKKIIGDE